MSIWSVEKAVPETATTFFTPASCEETASMLPSTSTAKSAFLIWFRSEEHTSELQSQSNLVCRLLLEKKKFKASAMEAMISRSRFTRRSLWLDDPPHLFLRPVPLRHVPDPHRDALQLPRLHRLARCAP